MVVNTNLTPTTEVTYLQPQAFVPLVVVTVCSGEGRESGGGRLGSWGGHPGLRGHLSRQEGGRGRSNLYQLGLHLPGLLLQGKHLE